MEKMRVLHIVSDKSFAQKIQKLVEANGFSYVQLCFGRETDEVFDEVFAETEYKLIVLDQFAPSLPVRELLAKIKAKNLDVPSIIVVSAQHDFEKEKYYSQLGIMAHFTKADFDEKRFAKYLQTIKAEAGNTAFLEAMRIAVLDDSRFNLDVIKQIFAAADIQKVDYYQDAAKFVEEKKQYDLYLVNLGMPGYCGEVLVNYIRQFNSEAIIILMTAHDNKQIIAHCLSLGADDFIMKPIDCKLFMLRINSCINHHKMKKELILKNNELLELAEKDNLTNIYNRTYFTKRYKESFLAAKQEGSPLALIMTDIDDFKNINDEYGHLEGDHVLKEFTAILQNNITADEVVCRWGGEEFITILKTGDLAKVMAVAEKMRSDVNAHIFKSATGLTASFGVACWRADDTKESLLRRLDNSLYLAKITGKNKIVCEEKVKVMENGVPIQIEWSPFWASGNEEIDKDHRKLVQDTNQIIANYVNNGNDRIVFTTLARIIKNMPEHFDTEEHIIQRLKYANYEEHRENHHELIAKTIDIYNACLAHKYSAMKVVEFIVQEILVGHIVKKDFGFYDIFTK